jgi:tetratricopeptide (TPR) repeat protein
MRSTAIITAVLLAASVSMAQTSATTPRQAAGTSPQTQGSAQQAQGTQQPTQGATPGQTAGAAQTPPAGGHRVLQAKSQDEMKAYQDAASKTDPAQLEAAADDFAAKYPSSDLRGQLYIRAMTLYGQSNNTDKVIECGRKAIAADPTNPVPLVQVASALAESTRETDLDREQRLAEAAKDAHAAIDNIDTGLLVPANADPAKVDAAKHTILSMAYDTLGMVDLNKADYASAEKNLQQAISQSSANPEAVLYLRLSVAQDKLKQYPQALDSANKAVQYAKEGSPAQNLAKQQQSRLQKLMTAEQPASGAAAPSPSPAPTPSPVPGAQPSQPQAPNSPTTPH